MGAEERQKFAADGYLVQRQILDPAALEPLRRAIDRLVDGHTRRLYDSAKIAHLYEGAAFQERWARVAHRHPNRQPLARSWGGAELLDRAVYDLYTHPRITAIATALLGAELMRPLLLPGFHCSASFSTGAATQNLWPGPRRSPLART